MSVPGEHEAETWMPAETEQVQVPPLPVTQLQEAVLHCWLPPASQVPEAVQLPVLMQPFVPSNVPERQPVSCSPVGVHEAVPPVAVQVLVRVCVDVTQHALQLQLAH